MWKLNIDPVFMKTHTAAQVAEYYKCSSGTVYNYEKKYKLKCPKYVQTLEKEIIEFYNLNKTEMTIAEMAGLFDIHVRTFRSVLKKYNVKYYDHRKKKDKKTLRDDMIKYLTKSFTQGEIACVFGLSVSSIGRICR